MYDINVKYMGNTVQVLYSTLSKYKCSISTLNTWVKQYMGYTVQVLYSTRVVEYNGLNNGTMLICNPGRRRVLRRRGSEGAGQNDACRSWTFRGQRKRGTKEET